MGHTKTRPRKSVDDYMRLPDDARVELIEGEFLMSPSPTSGHQRLVLKLATLLQAHAEPRGLGTVLISPLDVVLPTGDVVQPDLIFVTKSRMDIIQDRIRGVPDLLVEVVSPGSEERDRIVKREIYARGGVREFWLVEEAFRSVEVLVLRGGRYEPHGYFESGETMTSPLLAGLSIAPDTLFG